MTLLNTMCLNPFSFHFPVINIELCPLSLVVKYWAQVRASLVDFLYKLLIFIIIYIMAGHKGLEMS